jgi:hypothetical protein
MEQTECLETSAYKIQTMGNYPEESIQHDDMLLCKMKHPLKNEFKVSYYVSVKTQPLIFI